MLAKPVHEQWLLIFVQQRKISFQQYWYRGQAITYKKSISVRKQIRELALAWPPRQFDSSAGEVPKLIRKKDPKSSLRAGFDNAIA